MRQLDILTLLRFGGEGLKGAIRRTFGDGFVIIIFAFASRLTHFFNLNSGFTLHRNIWSNVIDRKLANAPNGILVTPEYPINSNSYSNIAFAGISAKVEIFGVIKRPLNYLLWHVYC